ncbi:MAG: hydrolase TatD [Gammaproteobacteria bacterium]|nr:MAG: hydrolase TatD [Gammaproteobacteria bacterium]
MQSATIDLIDIGVNLTHDSFAPDRDAVIERAAGAGVRRLIVTGTSVAASEAALALSQARPGHLFATAGLHPHHASDWDAAAGMRLAELLAAPEVVAAGECGLDYFRNYSSPAEQRRAFAAQLALAADCGKPVFLHQRDAFDDFIAVLREHLPALAGGVAHCFTGDHEQLQTCLELGLYIGITGWICDERRGQPLQAAVTALPSDRLLLETDAPYLLPRDLPERPRGRRNEPAFLPHILERLAVLMQLEPARLAAAATANTQRLFRLPPG